MINILQYQYIIYILGILLSIISAMYITVANVRYKEEESVFNKKSIEIFKERIPYFVMYTIIQLITYLMLVYITIKDKPRLTYLEIVGLVQGMIISPLLVITFCIDVRERIIPNRVTMLLFQIAVVFSIIATIDINQSSFNILQLKQQILGMVFAFGIFATMAVLGGIIAGKEAMGMGDIKFMTPIGLLFGIGKIFDITLGAFLISVVYAIIIIIYRKIKKIDDEYIPFGPFLVLSIYIMMFLSDGAIVQYFVQFTNMIADKILMLF